MTSFICGSLSQQLLGSRDDFIRGEAKLFQEIFERGRRAEGAHAEYFTLRADVAVPAEDGAHFDGNARGNGGGENGFAVSGVLLFEELPGRHADDAGLDAVGSKFLFGDDNVLDFGAACEKKDI